MSVPFPPTTTLGWLGLILAGIGILRAIGYLRGIPYVTKKNAAIVAVVGLLLFAVGEGILASKPATMVSSDTDMPALATFDVDVVSYSNGVTYDKDSNTFTIAVAYDVANDRIIPPNVTMTFTIKRTDLGTDDAIAKVMVNNVEWYNLTTKYTLLDKALITPEGGAASEDSALVLLPAASSKSVTIQLLLDKEAIKSIDVYGSKSFTIQIDGKVFTVNVIRTADVSGAAS